MSPSEDQSPNELIAKSTLFSSLPPAVLCDEISKTLQYHFLIHGGSVFDVSPHRHPTAPSPLSLWKLPITTPCLVFVHPQSQTLLVDHRDFPLVKYNFHWILDCITSNKILELIDYIVPYPSILPLFIQMDPASKAEGESSRYHSSPIVAMEKKYRKISQEVRAEISPYSMDIPEIHKARLPKVFIGDALITLETMYLPDTHHRTIQQINIGNGEWLIVPSHRPIKVDPRNIPSSSLKTETHSQRSKRVGEFPFGRPQKKKRANFTEP